MPTDRYQSRRTIVNTSYQYREIFKKRNVSFIEHYRSGRLRYPTPTQMRDLSIDNHIWVLGDKYWKLAEKSYGDPSLWWILAWFNKKPTEAHVNNGDIFFIPHPLERLYAILAI